MRPGPLGPSCHHHFGDLRGALVRDTWRLVSASCPIAGPAGSMATSWAQRPQATWRSSSPVAQVRAVRGRPGAARPGGGARGDKGRRRLARGADRPAETAGRPGLAHTLTAAGRPTPRYRASSWGAVGRGQDAACRLRLPAGLVGRRHRETPAAPAGKPRTTEEPNPGRMAHAHAQVHKRLSESAPGTAERSAQAP